MSERKLYIFLTLACLLGYGWVYYNSSSSQENTVCYFKTITHLPCPSCGATRSVQHLIHGDIKQALLTNPLGIVIAAIMMVTPLWILFDVFFKRNSAYRFYCQSEKVLQKRMVCVPLIALVVMNWIWNIAKDL